MAKIPLEQISIGISKSERAQLEALAEERGKSLSGMARQAIQAYLYAIRHQRKKVIQGQLLKKSLKTEQNR